MFAASSLASIGQFLAQNWPLVLLIAIVVTPIAIYIWIKGKQMEKAENQAREDANAVIHKLLQAHMEAGKAFAGRHRPGSFERLRREAFRAYDRLKSEGHMYSGTEGYERIKKDAEAWIKKLEDAAKLPYDALDLAEDEADLITKVAQAEAVTKQRQAELIQVIAAEGEVRLQLTRLQALRETLKQVTPATSTVPAATDPAVSTDKAAVTDVS